MSLSVILTHEEAVASTTVRAALHRGVAALGSAVLLVPSFATALEVQKRLATEPGLALSVTTTSPAAWVRERWEVWGDGRTVAKNVASTVVAHEVLAAAQPQARGPIEYSEGMVSVLVQLVSQVAPWLPLDEQNHVREDVCHAAGLTHAETCMVGLVGAVRSELARRGFVASADAMAAVPQLLAEAGVRVPAVVVAGFSRMTRAERELVQALGELTDVTLAIPTFAGPAAALALGLAGSFDVGALTCEAANAPACEEVAMTAHEDADTPAHECAGAAICDTAVPARDAANAPVRDGRLTELRDALFGVGVLTPTDHEPVELLLPAGPVAEGELVARTVERLLEADGCQSVVVAVPDTRRAQRELLPKLAARGVSARMQRSKALLDCPAAQAFFAFAHTVAHLAELAATWPEPIDGLEGPVPQLGDMSWWPPRELSDFLLADVSHTGVRRGWRADTTWRGNRLLSPEQLLTQLQSGRDTSDAVAQATQELLRGRIGTAASRLLAPYVMTDGKADGGGNAGDGKDGAMDATIEAPPATPVAANGDQEACAALQAILNLAGTLRELGVTADPSVPGAVSLAELVDLCETAARGMQVVGRVALAGTPGTPGTPRVAIMDVREASSMPPASMDALVICGMTTAESPIGARDGLVDAVLDRLGIEPIVDPMARARASFRALIGTARTRLVLERATHDADAKLTYPSVMLSELLATYGIGASTRPDELPLTVHTRPETLLSENLLASGRCPQATMASELAPPGWLTDASRGLVFVPQDGSDHLPDGKPLLSASQIETYLDCPYKWFSLRRLRLGGVDAGHGGMEMGSFAHRVLEVTHRELLLRALEAQRPSMAREELLAAIEADPAVAVPGSRVSPDNLAAAQAALDLEFDLHQQHMYMTRRARPYQQLLIAHNVSEQAQEDRLREDMHSAMAYQTKILHGFEPRLFEWSFGRHGDLVEYAGAYFTGTVDRIDVSPHGTAVIIDYKHKSPNGFAAEYDALQPGVVEGEQLPHRVQSLIYAQVVRRAFEGRLRLVGTAYLSTKSPHALAGAADENVVDLVFGRVSKQRLPKVSVPHAADGAAGMDALLDQTESLVAEQVRRMLSGDVEARPRDKNSCDFCPVTLCERRVAR